MLAAALLLLTSASWALPACPNAAPPRLTGDLFDPVSCSTAVLTAPDLQTPPLEGGKASLRDLGGRWTGDAEEGFGRYALSADLTVHWLGRAEGTLTLVELQTRRRVQTTLTLVPAKGAGRYAAELTSRMLPGKALRGTAVLSQDGKDRVLDLTLENGTRYLVRIERPDAEKALAEVRLAAPGGPPRTFEARFTRAPSR
jgi:hypothetical protein